MFVHLYVTDDIVDLLFLELNRPRDETVKAVCEFIATTIPTRLGFPDPVRLHTAITYDVTNESRPDGIHERYVSDGLHDGGGYIVVAGVGAFDRDRVFSIREKVKAVLKANDCLDAPHEELLSRVMPEDWDEQDYAFGMASFLALSDQTDYQLVSLELKVGETVFNTVIYREKGNPHV